MKQKTIYPGVRFREHSIRKYNGVPDRYFFIRYRLHGKLKEEGLGWASEGWNAKKASGLLAKLKEAHTTGEGPQTLSEKRQFAQKKKELEEAEKKKRAHEQLTFGELFLNTYFPQAQENKGAESFRRESSLFRLWISPVIGDLPLKDVTGFHLERLKKNMADGKLTARTIRYALAVIRQVFNFARDHNLYNGESPTAKIKMPQADNRRHRFLTRDEAAPLLENLSLKSPQVYEMALVSLHCGLRAGEIFSLTWGDVDSERGLMILRDTKGGKNRAAFMTQAVKEMLSKKPRRGNNDLVFPNRGGDKIIAISRSFDRAVRELNLNEGVTDPRQKIVFHSLRHSYASWLVESGVDLYTVKTLLGHSSLAMAERYSHLGNGTLQNAVKILEKSIASDGMNLRINE
jgi:integrase